MSYIQFLFDRNVNGVHCTFCGADLSDEKERAIASTRGGIKYFCRADEEHPQDSCFNQWRLRQN